jgi:hypothetical protein
MENYNLVELNEDIINSTNKTIYKYDKLTINNKLLYNISATFWPSIQYSLEPTEEPTEYPYLIYTNVPSIYPTINYIPKKEQLTDKEITYIVVFSFLVFFFVGIYLFYKKRLNKNKHINDIENADFGVNITDTIVE